ncbi:MAG: antibiotic biosynthesis monooxygenase [Alphaproteobacteria bacterium]
MFAVLFEVHLREERRDAYLAYAAMLRPELERIEGFVENVRYRSLTRPGWLLSLSTWRDEKALVRWRSHALHHEVQGKGRREVFRDYHLRVGQLTHDTRLPPDHMSVDERPDVTEAGAATTVTLADAARPAEWLRATPPAALAGWLGLAADAPGLAAWDVFEAVLTPGDVIMLASWREAPAASPPQAEARLRRVRVIRDYGMFDRREAPQHHPDVVRAGGDQRMK